MQNFVSDRGDRSPQHPDSGEDGTVAGIIDDIAIVGGAGDWVPKALPGNCKGSSQVADIRFGSGADMARTSVGVPFGPLSRRRRGLLLHAARCRADERQRSVNSRTTDGRFRKAVENEHGFTPGV